MSDNRKYYYLKLKENFFTGEKRIQSYSGSMVDGCDNAANRNTLVETKPYKNGPDEIGVFALGSPERPNPVAVSNQFLGGTIMALTDFINNKPTIETDRLVIRPMTAEDIPALKEWMPDKSIYTYWGKGPSEAEKNSELLFKKEEKGTKGFHLGIELKTSNKVMGDLWVYLIENDRMASVAIRLSKECHGKGFGTEALSAMTRFCFENTELQRLWTKVDVQNVASCRMLEKCGYMREGLIRQGKMVNTWCDYYIYGVLASDYRK